MFFLCLGFIKIRLARTLFDIKFGEGLRNFGLTCFYLDTKSKLIIGDDVWIATGAVILPGTHIGSGSIISANSVVKGDIPPMSLVAGNPGVIHQLRVEENL